MRFERLKCGGLVKGLRSGINRKLDIKMSKDDVKGFAVKIILCRYKICDRGSLLEKGQSQEWFLLTSNTYF